MNIYVKVYPKHSSIHLESENENDEAVLKILEGLEAKGQVYCKYNNDSYFHGSSKLTGVSIRLEQVKPEDLEVGNDS